MLDLGLSEDEIEELEPSKETQTIDQVIQTVYKSIFNRFDNFILEADEKEE